MATTKEEKKLTLEQEGLKLWHGAIADKSYHVYSKSEFDAAEYIMHKFFHEDGGKVSEGDFVEVWEA